MSSSKCFGVAYDNYPKNWDNKIEKFYEIDELLKSQKKIKQNQMKKMKKELSAIKTEVKNFESDLKKYRKYIDLENEIRYNQEIVTDYPNLISTELTNIISLLSNNGYVQDNKITLKGIFATEINECNELLLTEIIQQKMLEELEPHEIITILSILIREGKSNEPDILPENNTIPRNILNILDNIRDISSYYVREEQKYGINSEIEWEPNLSIIQMAYIWGQGKSINEVYQYMDIYEGNFIRCMIQINNLSRSIMSICELIGNSSLYKKLEGIENVLIRDIVTLDSLYIQNDSL